MMLISAGIEGVFASARQTSSLPSHRLRVSASVGGRLPAHVAQVLADRLDHGHAGQSVPKVEQILAQPFHLIADPCPAGFDAAMAGIGLLKPTMPHSLKAIEDRPVQQALDLLVQPGAERPSDMGNTSMRWRRWPKASPSPKPPGGQVTRVIVHRWMRSDTAFLTALKAWRRRSRRFCAWRATKEEKHGLQISGGLSRGDYDWRV
jgi:hypothetical protein